AVARSPGWRAGPPSWSGRRSWWVAEIPPLGARSPFRVGRRARTRVAIAVSTLLGMGAIAYAQTVPQPAAPPAQVPAPPAPAAQPAAPPAAAPAPAGQAPAAPPTATPQPSPHQPATPPPPHPPPPLP